MVVKWFAGTDEQRVVTDQTARNDGVPHYSRIDTNLPAINAQCADRYEVAHVE